MNLMEWLARLTAKLNRERGAVDKLDRYYRGEQPLPEVPDAFRPLFRDFQRSSRTNYLSLVAEAPLERMRVDGLRVGDTQEADKATWDRWQRANLDADQLEVHRNMLALRRGYTMVSRHPRKPGEILITSEHPSQMMVESYPEDRRELRAGLKLWEDDYAGTVRANLYFPKGELGLNAGHVFKFEGPRNTTNDLLGSLQQSVLMSLQAEWKLIDDGPTGIDDLPITVFQNRYDARHGPRAEFEDVTDIQDRINSVLFHRLVAERFGSFRQTVILNYVMEEDDDGNPIPPQLRRDAGSAWIFQPGDDGPGVSIFEMSQIETSGLIEAVASDIRDLAAITRTPPHYLLANMVNVTSDALTVAETGLISKVRMEHMPEASVGWEHTMRKAAELSGDNTDFTGAEVLWADPEFRTLAEKTDAATKQAALGVPFRDLMTMLGKTPQEIDRMEAAKAKEDLRKAMLAPQLAPQAQPGQNQPQDGSGQPQDAQQAQGGPTTQPA